MGSWFASLHLCRQGGSVEKSHPEDTEPGRAPPVPAPTGVIFADWCRLRRGQGQLPYGCLSCCRSVRDTGPRRAGHNQSSTQHDLSPWAHGAQVVYATGLAPMSTHYCHIQKQRMAVSGASVESICPEISCVLRIAQVE